MSRGGVWSVLALLAGAFACGDDDGAYQPPPPPEPDLVRDAHAMQDVMGTDPATGVLEEVDLQVEDEHPIRASEMIRDAALPAARRQVTAVEGLRDGMRTVQGSAILGRLLEAYRKRVAALERYGRALARGVVEDMELLDAMREQREVEVELTGLHDELARIRPLAEERPVRGVRDPRDRVPEEEGGE